MLKEMKMHYVTKIKSIGEEERANPPDNYWHFVVITSGDRATLCQGLFLDGANIDYDIKKVGSGGITCEECMRIISEFKSVKL